MKIIFIYIDYKNCHKLEVTINHCQRGCLHIKYFNTDVIIFNREYLNVLVVHSTENSSYKILWKPCCSKPDVLCEYN